MRKKRRTPSGKSSKPMRGAHAAASQADPEWDVLEERFAASPIDFGSLAKLVGDQ